MSVIGKIRESKQDLSRKVGMISREQEEMHEIKTVFRLKILKLTPAISSTLSSTAGSSQSTEQCRAYFYTKKIID